MRFSVPLKTVNRTNAREHWGDTAKRTKRERAAIGLVMKPKLSELGSIRLVVLLTRTGPNELDDDGLRAALKGVRDGVASVLRVDDATPLVRWDYKQTTGEASVEVEISWEVPGASLPSLKQVPEPITEPAPQSPTFEYERRTPPKRTQLPLEGDERRVRRLATSGLIDHRNKPLGRRCPKCGSLDTIDASQSLDCNSCGAAT